MKKLVFFSKQSLFSGKIDNGIAEVVDGLASSLTSEYKVSVICSNGDSALASTVAEIIKKDDKVSFSRFFKIDYYLIEEEAWLDKGIEIINQIQPEIIHAFDEPNFIEKIEYKPQRVVFTFDDLNFLIKNLKILEKYDAITTFSEEYLKIAKNFLKEKEISHNINFQNTKIGIVTDIFSPTKGLLLPVAYNKDNLIEKEKSKKRLKEKYGIKNNAPIILTLCRLVKAKGIENIISSFSSVANKDIVLLIIGEGEKQYEELLFEASKHYNNIIFINNFGSPMQVIPLAAGADFYLQPSLMESGGIMPMIMSMYGTIPITTLNGGLKDNFNSDNAIIVENNDVALSLEQAMYLYKRKEFFQEKQKKAMSQPFSWNERKKDFINIYEMERI